jgi:hypothetical protein
MVRLATRLIIIDILSYLPGLAYPLNTLFDAPDVRYGRPTIAGGGVDVGREGALMLALLVLDEVGVTRERVGVPDRVEQHGSLHRAHVRRRSRLRIRHGLVQRFRLERALLEILITSAVLIAMLHVLTLLDEVQVLLVAKLASIGLAGFVLV